MAGRIADGHLLRYFGLWQPPDWRLAPPFLYVQGAREAMISNSLPVFSVFRTSWPSAIGHWRPSALGLLSLLQALPKGTQESSLWFWIDMFPVRHETFKHFLLYNVLIYQFGLRQHWNRTYCSVSGNSVRSQSMSRLSLHYKFNMMDQIYLYFPSSFAKSGRISLKYSNSVARRSVWVL